MSLAELQAQFMAALYSDDSSELCTHLLSTGKRSAEQQCQVYRSSVQGGLVGALGDIFSRVKQALGPKFFDAMAIKYVQTHPSVSPSLDDYGEAFPDFCQGFPALNDYPFVADIAHVDWAWHRTFHAPDCAFSAVPPDAQTLAMHPTCKIVSSSFPLYQLWLLNDEASRGNEAAELNLDQPEESVLVWRPERQVKTMCLDAERRALLKQIQVQPDLSSAFEATLETNPELWSDPEKLSAQLSLFIAEGVLYCPDR